MFTFMHKNMEVLWFCLLDYDLSKQFRHTPVLWIALWLKLRYPHALVVENGRMAFKEFLKATTGEELTRESLKLLFDSLHGTKIMKYKNS